MEQDDKSKKKKKKIRLQLQQSNSKKHTTQTQTQKSSQLAHKDTLLLHWSQLVILFVITVIKKHLLYTSVIPLWGTTVSWNLWTKQCHTSEEVWEQEVVGLLQLCLHLGSASTRICCQLEATHMTHLTPPLEPWLEIIGLFLQLNRWHTVPGWMSASPGGFGQTKCTHSLFLPLFLRVRE